MRFQRRSAIALAATTSGTLLVGVIAAVNVFDLPVLGFNAPDSVETLEAGSPDTTTTLSGTAQAGPEGDVTTTTLAATVAPAGSGGGSVAAPAPQQTVSPGTSSGGGSIASAPSSGGTSASTQGTQPTTKAPVTTVPRPVAATTTTTAPKAACAFTGIDTVGKYTTGGIEAEKGANLDTRVTVRTSGTCTGPMTMTFASPAYTLTLSGSGGTWTGGIPKGALRGLVADQSLSATLKVGGAANAQVTLKVVVQNGSGSGSGS
jgi:hypothetical protein